MKSPVKEVPENDHHLRAGGKMLPKCLPSGSAQISDVTEGTESSRDLVSSANHWCVSLYPMSALLNPPAV